MGQFSPRIVRAILHDRRSQLAVGLFIGTFAYSMTVLREVNGKSSGGAPVPGLAVGVDYGLILSAIVVLVLYVHHTAQSIRAGGLIGWVADATREEVGSLPKPHRSAAALSVILDRERTHEFEPAFGCASSSTSPDGASTQVRSRTRPPPCRRSMPSTTSSAGSPAVSFPPDTIATPMATSGSWSGS